MALLQRAYRFRLKPAAEQDSLLLRSAGARRWCWNWGLARKRAHYQATKRGLGVEALQKELTALKQQTETAWLREIDSQLLQQALQDLQRAFAAYCNFA